jgi:glycosyltransferase involved in cell wall biosynthesis
MEKNGFGKKIPIKIVNPGVELTKFKVSKKSTNPSVIYLGRLKPYKSIDRLIQVFAEVVKKVPQATLTIAGEGESRPELEVMTTKLGLENVVKFLGKVSEEAKVRLYAESWVVAQPSKSEGWGITVIEANACGTPVIASDVPGLRDSVKNPHSGLLVTWDNEEKWADAIVRVLKDDKLRESLEKQAQIWSRQFTWDQSSQRLITIINKEVSK